MYALNNGPVTWALLWIGAIVAICAFTYLGRRVRRQWEEEAGYHDD